MPDDFASLCAKALALYDALTPEEKAAHDREQMISFTWGNLACSTNHHVSREAVIAAVDKLLAEKAVRGEGK